MAVFGQAVHPRLADVNGDFVPNAVDLFACVLSGQILSWISRGISLCKFMPPPLWKKWLEAISKPSVMGDRDPTPVLTNNSLSDM